MKRKINIFILVGIILLLTGCSKNDLTGKYTYNNEGDPVYGYYDCNSKTCKWYMYLEGYGTSETEYSYEIKEFSEMEAEDLRNNEKYEGFAMITFTEIGEDATTYKVLYDSENKFIYDGELDIKYVIEE